MERSFQRGDRAARLSCELLAVARQRSLSAMLILLRPAIRTWLQLLYMAAVAIFEASHILEP